MKKVKFVAILLVSLSFTAFQTKTVFFDESDKFELPLDTIAADTLQKNNKLILKDSLTDSLSINKEDNLENDNVSIVEESKKLSAGKVSWYGGKFHGRLTSSGERYDMNAYTAAHKSLPFGTKVKIINPKNGKEVIVRITDRGPFVPKREFDLSKAAFAELASLNSGVLNVQYVVL